MMNGINGPHQFTTFLYVTKVIVAAVQVVNRLRYLYQKINTKTEIGERDDCSSNQLEHSIVK